MTPDQIDALLTGLFPRTVSATQQGGGFPRRVLAGSMDAASMPGRAWSALANQQAPIMDPRVAALISGLSNQAGNIVIGGGTEIPVTQPPSWGQAIAGKYLRDYLNQSQNQGGQQ